jgi:MHS family proline/betaine transporter-like MFS transporter
MRPITFLAAIIGNVLEYFDFLLFAHFSFILTPLFFSNTNPTVTSIVTLGLFAVGFIVRPIGGLLFGTMGDRLGRKTSLTRSILWIALPTFCIGCMPTYETIGFFATFLVLMCRIMQGLSLGGEYANAGIFLMEHVDKNKRGFYSGLLVASGSVGSLAGLGCVYLVLRSGTIEWGWRIPFLLSSILGMCAYQLRKYLSETPEFVEFSNISQGHQNKKLSGWKEILSKKQAFLTTIGIGALVSVLVWIPVTYTNFYLTKTLGWSATEAMPMIVLALVNFIVSAIFMGYLGDKLGFSRMMQIAAFVTILSAYPLFYALVSGYVVFAQIGFTVLAAAFGATVHAAMVSLYPAEERCRAISVGISTGISLGGASPMIAASLVTLTGDELSPALYVIFLAMLGLVAMLYYKPYKMVNFTHEVEG